MNEVCIPAANVLASRPLEGQQTAPGRSQEGNLATGEKRRVNILIIALTHGTVYKPATTCQKVR